MSQIFGDATIYLFGSRLDPDKKGGDIDLYVVTEINENLVEKKIKTLSKLERVLHKPVDMVVHRDFSRAIEQEALRGERL